MPSARELKRNAASLKNMENLSGRIELDYVRDVGSLPLEWLIRFYEILAHNLTVSIRAIWSNEELDDNQRVQQIKWVNAIMHRVLLKSAALRMNRNECPESDTWQMIQDYVAQCPELAPHIAFATISSYQAVNISRGAAQHALGVHSPLSSL